MYWNLYMYGFLSSVEWALLPLGFETKIFFDLLRTEPRGTDQFLKRIGNENETPPSANQLPTPARIPQTDSRVINREFLPANHANQREWDH